MTLRELRAWHWRQFKLASAQEQKHIDAAAAQPDTPVGRMFRRRANLKVPAYRVKATLHMKAVQALNDVVSGTAEEDTE